jgi:ATP-dependent protease ClpP protease subunit
MSAPAARPALASLRQRAANMRRIRALRALGEMKGYQRLARDRRLQIKINGNIGMEPDIKGRVVDPLDVEMRLAANPRATDIDVEIDSCGGSVKARSESTRLCAPTAATFM